MYLLSDGSFVIFPAFASQTSFFPVRTATTPSKTISESGTEYSKFEPGIGPVFAIAEAERRTGLSLDHADLIEINEAFAAQVLACLRCLKSDEFAQSYLKRERHMGKVSKEILNVNGGAIALGHPLGCSGAKLSIQLWHELERQNKKYGIVTACVGGGQGIAGVWERLN